MHVKLKVIQGSHKGVELPIKVQEFVIGRSDECHLRPRSDVISRRHCSIVVDATGVTLRDFGSKNGTYVNDERVKGSRELKMGDVLKIGPLEFEVVVDHTLGGSKKAKVKDVKEAAKRAAEASDAGLDDQDVSRWLEEADEVDRAQRMADPETRQFKMEETDHVPSKDGTSDDKKSAKPEKKEPGKLPSNTGPNAKDSQEAARQTLRRLFKRGGS
jgi:pSer/pThr/pTyr-binding forkhead associated (FHA) protein